MYKAWSREKWESVIQRLTETSEQTEDLVNDYLDGKIVYVPEDLVDYCLSVKEWEGKKRRIEFKEGLIVTWHIIHSSYYEETAWKYVNSANLLPVYNDSEVTAAAKRCLAAGGFLNQSGQKAIPKVRPLKYQTYYSGNVIAYAIKSPTKYLTNCIAKPKPDDELYQDRPELPYQQQCLAMLEVNRERAADIAQKSITNWTLGIDEEAGFTLIRQMLGNVPQTKRQQELTAIHLRKIEKRTAKLREELAEKELTNEEIEIIKGEINRIENSPMSDNEKLSTFALPILKLITKSGRLTVGPLSGRIFTPLTNLPKPFRQSLTWTGDNLGGRWEIIDLICSQPTLIAYSSSDQKMIKDVLNRNYYERIAEELGQTRDEAKESFCQYAYGENRHKLTKKNVSAWKIQQMMRADYPDAHKYIWDGKKKDHKLFIQKLQQRESDIFIKQIYPQVMKRKIPAATIHDGLFCPVEYGQEVYEIARNTLKSQPETIQQDLDRETGPDDDSSETGWKHRENKN